MLRARESGVYRFALAVKSGGPRRAVAPQSFRSPQRAEATLDIELRLLAEDIYGLAVPSFPDLDIGRAYWGARTEFPFGGDMVDVFRCNNGCTSIAVIDISGHGLRSAKHAGLAKYALRAYTSQGYDALGAIRALNRLFIENCSFEGENELFATTFFAIIDAERRSMRYVSAGHEAACLVRGDGRLFFDATGPILGLMDDDLTFHQATLALEPDDIVAAVTDGFTEARNEQGEFLGSTALADVVERNRDLTAEEQAQGIVRRAVAYAGPRLTDDVAAMVLRVS
jgi:sigma-B regulation protein RsbU (phosphoserine phosphatase)